MSDERKFVTVELIQSHSFDVAFHFDDGEMIVDEASSPEMIAAIPDIFPSWILEAMCEKSKKSGE